MRLIDADALPTLATELRLKNGKTKHFVGVEFDDIKNAPTIDPVRHGRWRHSEYAGIDYYQCSLCGHSVSPTAYNYCPNCGAKMDGGENR